MKFLPLVCSTMQCLTVHKVCKEHSSQYYSRFHDPSRDLKATCQSTPFKRGSVSPFSAHSLRIHAMKEQEQEHCISTTVLTVCKNKRLVCIDKSLILYAYILMSLVCSCIYVTYMLIYAMLDSSHNKQRTLTSISQQVP